MHLGPVLIIAGAIWGSVEGLRIREALGAEAKIARGVLRVGQGESENRVLVRAEGAHQVGQLDFEVHLNRFWIENYPTDSGKAPSIKAYKSDVTILNDGREVLRRTIEVNKPLHYGGYHLYQVDYDHKAQRFTELSVVSDSGLYAVYLGMVMLGIGAVLFCLWPDACMKRAEGSA